jgi:hypothetical protein
VAFGTLLPAVLPDPTTRPIRYIDPVNGNDAWTGANPTVSGTTGPWKTLTKGFANLPAVLELMDTGQHGTSGVAFSVSGKNGTATQPWVVRSWSGNSSVPVLRGQINCDSSTFGKWEGLNFQGASVTGVTNSTFRFYNATSNCQIIDCEVDGNRGNHNSAMYVSVTGANANLLIQNCWIHDNGTTAGSDTTSQGLYWHNGSGAIVNSRFSGNGMSGIQFYFSLDNDTVYVSNCQADGNNDGFHFSITSGTAVMHLYNCVAINNVGTRGNGISTGSGSGFTLDVRDCATAGNEQAQAYGAITPTQSGNVHLGGTVGAGATTLGLNSSTFMPNAGSAVIGIADNEAASWPTDANGVTRVFPHDTGRFEFVSGGGATNATVTATPAAAVGNETPGVPRIQVPATRAPSTTTATPPTPGIRIPAPSAISVGSQVSASTRFLVPHTAAAAAASSTPPTPKVTVAPTAAAAAAPAQTHTVSNPAPLVRPYALVTIGG